VQEPTSGKVIRPNAISAKKNLYISNVFQDLRLLGRYTCEENLMFAYDSAIYKDKSEFVQDMHELCRILGIKDRLNLKINLANGGLQQKVAIVRSLLTRPDILIADEPTTALDVTVQAQILDLLRDLQQKVGMALILITHDLGVVAEVSDEVVVMYAGRVVEHGGVMEIFKNPKMPYTRGLLRSTPTLKVDSGGRIQKDRLETIPGIVPNLLHLPRGCRFQDRCSHVVEVCRASEPGLRVVGEDAGRTHSIRCARDI
jgi:oligopeptide/dipeptide ABC transporter ATP-binding protein